MTLHILTSVTLLATAAQATSANWPSWRGPGQDGNSTDASPPTSWDVGSNKNILWKQPLPGKGCSTPVVWGDHIFVTAPAGGENALINFDWSGKRRWTATLGDETKGKHKNGSGSNPSPVTDGETVFTLFKSGHLAAVDFTGKTLWETNLTERFGRPSLYWDFGTSPVLTDNAVVVASMHGGESYIAAFAKKSGDLLWKIDRNYETPVEADHSYASPLVIDHNGTQAILVWGAQHLTAHAASDGKLLWSCAGFNPEGKKNWVAVSSPVVIGDIAVVPFGRGSRLHGIRLGGSGDVTATHRLWVRDGTGTFVPTPASHNNNAILGRDAREVEAVDPKTGKTVWAAEFPKDSSKFYASPTIAGDHLYAAREDGVVFTAKIAPEFELLAEIDMGERTIASPVPVGDKLLLRGEKHLFCIGAN